MTEGVLSSGLLFSEEDMEAPRLFALNGGHAALFTSKRPGREGRNEDAALLVPREDGSAVLAVADGMGGQRAGGRAARLALEELERFLGEAGRGEGADEGFRAAILNAIEAANRKIRDLGLGAGTTLAVAELMDGGVRTYHVGDSAILVTGQRGRLKLETLPHSPTGYAVEAGFLAADEALRHDERHMVSNVVGADDMRIEVGSRIPLAPRDTLLVASDGLFDNLTIQEVTEIIRKGPLERAAAALATTCRERMLTSSGGGPSKPDDLTFILYRRAHAVS